MRLLTEREDFMKFECGAVVFVFEAEVLRLSLFMRLKLKELLDIG